MARSSPDPIEYFWKWLLRFRVVAELEHLRAAAIELDVAPSGVSRIVAKLEASLGYELFERSGNRMYLTPKGKQLLTAVRRAVRAIETAEANATRASRRKAGRKGTAKRRAASKPRRKR